MHRGHITDRLYKRLWSLRTAQLPIATLVLHPTARQPNASPHGAGCIVHSGVCRVGVVRSLRVASWGGTLRQTAITSQVLDENASGPVDAIFEDSDHLFDDDDDSGAGSGPLTAAGGSGAEQGPPAGTWSGGQ